MLLKNWTLNKYNPDYFWDFEDATIETMTNAGSAGSATWTKSNTPAMFDISETYYGMWASSNGVLNYGTGTLQTTNSTIGAYLDNANFTVNFFIEFSKFAVSGNKNLLEFNYGSNSFALLILGTGVGTSNQNKLRITSGGTTVLTSTQQHWSYATTSPVVSGGFLDTPDGWSSANPGFMMVSVRFASGNVELYINGVLDTSASITAPSGTFTNFRVYGSSTSVNVLMDQLSIASNSVYTSTALLELWNMFLLGQTPADEATGSALFNDPVVSVTSPSVNISAPLATASALFPAPSPMIAEINPADLLTASALMNDATVDLSTPVNVTADVMTVSAQSGDHEYSWLHTRSLVRTDYYDPATDARYVFAEVSPASPTTNLWNESEQTGPSYPTISKTGPYLLFKPDIGDLNTSEIVKVVLKFKATDALSNTSFNIYALTTNWQLHNVTYNTRPTESLIQDDGIVFNVSSGADILLDITTAYEYLTSNSNHGFAIKLDSSSTTSTFDIAYFNYPDNAEVLVYLNVPPVNESNAGDLMTASALFPEAIPVMGVNLTVAANLMTASMLIRDPGVSGTANVTGDLSTASLLMREALVSVAEDNIPGVMTGSMFMNNPSIQTTVNFAAQTMTSSVLFNDPTVTIGFDAYVQADPMLVTLAHLIQPQSPADIFAWNYYKALYTIGTKQVADPEQSPNEYWSSLVYAGQFTTPNYRTVAGAQDRNTALTWHYPCDKNLTGIGQKGLSIRSHPQTASQWTGPANGLFYSRIYDEVPRAAGETVAAIYIPQYSYTGPEYRPQLIFNGQNYIYLQDGGQSDVGTTTQGTIRGSYYGSNELTIRTTKQNQSLFSTLNRTISSREDYSSIETVKDINYKSGPSIVNNNVLNFTTYGDSSRENHDDNAKETNASYTVWDDYNKYVRFSGTDQYRNYGEVKMIDGKIAFYYKNRVTNEEKIFVGKTNIADDKNHHIVLNRTNDGFGKDNKSDKKKKSCLELWVDGKLEVRTYEIDDSYWFNNMSYLGIGWEDTLTENFDLGQVKEIRPVAKSAEAFVGTLSDYIFRAARPLTQNEIKLLAVTCFGEIPKLPEKATATAKINEPVVTTNSTKILRLYWNIQDKQQNGVSVSSPYDTSTYNVSKQLFNHPGEVFNYDKANKQFTEKLEVKTAADRWINIFNPQMVQTNSIITSTTWGPGGDGYAYSSEHVGPGNTGEKYLPELIIGNYSVQTGDRILLTGQKDPRENGVWVFQGLGTPMTRPSDLIKPTDVIGAVVYVRYGEFANKYFACLNDSVAFTEHYALGHKVGKTSEFNWKEINYVDEFASSPIELDYWRDDEFEARFIDINNDIDIDKYDVIAFMNYPESSDDIVSQIADYDSQYVNTKYKEFIQTLKDAVIGGKSLMINSPRLAHDFGMISGYETVDQQIDLLDIDAANDNPFEVDQDSSRYFNNNRLNRYRTTLVVSGLNNRQTYELADFINYIPAESWKNDEYHAKYVFKQNGHQVGDEFIIPSLPLRKVQASEEFESYAPNQIRATKLFVVPSAKVANGEVVTRMSASINSSTANPYTNYATTIILRPGATIDGQTIAGKVFFNCVEDALTMTRPDYNTAVIQDVSLQDIDENQETIAWQYSTSRLDRSRVEDVATNLDYLGQTVPTSAGGGAIIQAPTNESNGTIRSEKDSLLPERKSILYPDLEEEVNELVEIPVYSMTYLGLKWLGGE
jgi:hypothetical protein